jgi:DNA-binding NtrC family response regulator
MTSRNQCAQWALVLGACARRARSGGPREVQLRGEGPRAYAALLRTAADVLSGAGYVVQTDAQFAASVHQRRSRDRTGPTSTLAVVVRSRPVSASVAAGFRWLSRSSTLPHLVISLVDGPYQAAEPLVSSPLAVADASRGASPAPQEAPASPAALEVAEAVARWDHMMAPSTRAAEPALRALGEVLRRRGRVWEARALDVAASPDEVPRLLADDVLALLRTSHRVSHPRDGIEQHLTFLCDRLRADGAWVIPATLGRESSPIGARPPRSWAPSARLREAVRSRVSYRGRSGGTVECCVPLHVGDTLVGMLATCFDLDPEVQGTDADALLEAVGLVLAPLVVAASGTGGLPLAGEDLVGESAAIRRVRAAITQAAATPFPVLIEGESGTGKELVARALHRQSARRDRRFVAVNCAGLSDELAASELFGCVRGAYTGAQADRAGIFEAATGGVVFLDEVSELSLRVQATLLRVLQEHEVRRVGESQSRKVDVRIVAASNRPLRDAVEAGRFRADLRFRLEVIHLAVPPLRERLDDLPLLVEHLWASLMRRTGARGVLSPATVAALQLHHWPGNIRELQNVLAMTMVMAGDRAHVGPECLPSVLGVSGPGEPEGGGGLIAARSAFERRCIAVALTRADGSVTRAARALGMTRQGLAKMMARLKVPKPAAGAGA